MEEVLKKFLYTGVGLVAVTAEKVQKLVDELVSDKKISEDEGKRIVEDLVKTTDQKREDFEKQLKTLIEKTVSSFKFVSANELQALTDRIEALEAKQKTTKTTAKKEEVTA